MTQWVRDTKDATLFDVLIMLIELAFNLLVVILQGAWVLICAIFTYFIKPPVKWFYKNGLVAFTDYVWEKIRQRFPKYIDY